METPSTTAAQKTGVIKCPNWTSPKCWGYNFQQIFEGDVQYSQNGTFTNPQKDGIKIWPPNFSTSLGLARDMERPSACPGAGKLGNVDLWWWENDSTKQAKTHGSLPSGELTFCHGKIHPCLMGKSTISMAMFNCYVSSPKGTGCSIFWVLIQNVTNIGHWIGPCICPCHPMSIGNPAGNHWKSSCSACARASDIKWYNGTWIRLPCLAHLCVGVVE